jgi:hypothetical protein
VIAVAFALAASGLLLAWHLPEFTSTHPKAQLLGPSPGSIAPLQPTAAFHDSQASKLPPDKKSLSPSNRQQKRAVTIVKDGQTLGGVSSRHLGQFNPKVARQIQASNPDIRDTDLIIAGTQIHFPSSTVHPDISTPSAGEVLNRPKEQQ